MSDKINRSYISEIDQLLSRFDKQNPTLSLSQQKEKTKYDAIYRKRDIIDRNDASTLPEWF